MATARVLVVEDEPTVLDFVDRALKSHGYEVLRASGPHQALEIVKTGPVDLVLSDVRLPEMSGIALAENITRVSPDTTILLMSGWPSSPEIPDGIEVLGKPFSPKALFERVEQVLAQMADARERLCKELSRAKSLQAHAERLLQDLGHEITHTSAMLGRSRAKQKERLG